MSDLEQSRADGIVTLRLNRPDRLNAFSDAMLDRLQQALADVATDPGVGAVILTGAGRAFCAGGDVKSMEGRAARGPEDRIEALGHKHRLVTAIRRSPKVVIAMVNGPAFGAGLNLALACDFRIAAASARFGTAFVKIGFAGDFGGSYLLQKLVGAGKARELYMLGEPFGAQEALAWGAVTRVVPDEELEAATLDFARRLAALPGLAHAYMKRNFLAAETGTLQEVLDLEATHQARLSATEDHKEATRAFVEKRAPVFRRC